MAPNWQRTGRTVVHRQTPATPLTRLRSPVASRRQRTHELKSERDALPRKATGDSVRGDAVQVICGEAEGIGRESVFGLRTAAKNTGIVRIGAEVQAETEGPGG